MKKLALLIGLILMTTPLMAQSELAMTQVKPDIVGGRILGLGRVDKDNKIAIVNIEVILADGTKGRMDIAFQNTPEVLGMVEVGTIYLYNVSIDGDNQQIESEVELTEYQGEPVELDSTRPKMEEQVVTPAVKEYTYIMNQMDIDQVGLKQAVVSKLTQMGLIAP